MAFALLDVFFSKCIKQQAVYNTTQNVKTQSSYSTCATLLAMTDLHWLLVLSSPENNVHIDVSCKAS